MTCWLSNLFLFNTREAVTIVVQCGASRFPAARHHGGGHDVLHGSHLDEHKRAGVLQRAHQEGIHRGVQDGARLSGQEGPGPREGGPTCTLALALTLTLHFSLDAHSTTAHQPPRPPPRHRCPIGRRRGGTRSLCPSRAARPPRCTLGADRRGSTSTCIAPAPWSEAGGTTRSSPSSIGQPHPTPTPSPRPRPRLAPHLRHALLLARVSLPSVHAVPSPVRAPPPFPLATSLLPRGAHRPPAAHPTAAAPQDTGHTAARAAGSRAGQIDLVPDWLLLARQAYVRARPQQPAAASTVSLPRTASRTRTPTLTQTPNPHTSPYPNQERHHAPYSDRAPEPVCARGLANRRPDVVSIQ